MTTLRLRVRQRGRLASLRGIDIESIERSVRISDVPGCQFGMALVRGQIVPVLRLGETEGCLVVGRVHGEVLGIVGLDIVGFDLLDGEIDGHSDEALDEMGGLDGFRSDPSYGPDDPLELDVEAWIAKAKTISRPPA